jgi:hypothetical protein
MNPLQLEVPVTREMTRKQRVVIMIGSVVIGLIQFAALLYALHLDAEWAGALMVGIGMLAIISGWPMAALWVMGPATRAERWRGVMRALTGILSGVALLCWAGESLRWMLVSVVGASLTALLSFFPAVSPRARPKHTS